MEIKWAPPIRNKESHSMRQNFISRNNVRAKVHFSYHGKRPVWKYILLKVPWAPRDLWLYMAFFLMFNAGLPLLKVLHLGYCFCLASGTQSAHHGTWFCYFLSNDHWGYYDEISHVLHHNKTPEKNLIHCTKNFTSGDKWRAKALLSYHGRCCHSTYKWMCWGHLES